MAEQEPAEATTPALVKLNVGGRIFETTTSTLSSAGNDSLLSAVASSAAASYPSPFFIDRDPDLFAPLLSLLRAGRLPSSASSVSRRLLSHEAIYYGIHPLFVSALRPPPLSGLSASLSTLLLPPSDPLPSALHPLLDGSLLLLAHKGQISTFDHALSLSSTLRTHVDTLLSLRLLPSPLLAAAGSPSSPGLHIFHLPSSRHYATIHWSDPSDLRLRKACVAAIASTLPSSASLFASFESPHLENAILSFDAETLQVIAEIGRQNGGSTKTAVPGKLAEVSSGRLLFAATVSGGAFGYAGYMRLWDPRAGQLVWETAEPGSARTGRFGDAFSDADVDAEEGKIYKVCSKSGDVGVADLRMLRDDPWEYLVESSVRLRGVQDGAGSLVRCYKGQVFVARQAGLEVWARAPGEDGAFTWRRNYVDTEEDASKGAVTMMEAGGDRLFICREGMVGVEVWESSSLSGAVPLP